MGDVAEAQVVQSATPTRRTIAPEHRYRGGGKPGRTMRRAPQVLRDARLVYANPEAARSPGQLALRKLFETEPTVFVRDLARLESAHTAASAPTRPFDLDDSRHSPAAPDPAA
jgi:hypothetical protein